MDKKQPLPLQPSHVDDWPSSDQDMTQQEFEETIAGFQKAARIAQDVFLVVLAVIVLFLYLSGDASAGEPTDKGGRNEQKTLFA